MLSAGGGCEITVTTCVKTAWKKFRTTSLTRPVAMYTALVCGAPCSMPVKLMNLQRLQGNDRAMIRQI